MHFPQELGKRVNDYGFVFSKILRTDFIRDFKQDFLKLVKSYHWMGLVQNAANGSWQWEDGSLLSPSQ